MFGSCEPCPEVHLSGSSIADTIDDSEPTRSPFYRARSVSALAEAVQAIPARHADRLRVRARPRSSRLPPHCEGSVQVAETIAAVATQVRDALPGCAGTGIDIDPVAAVIDA